MASPVSVVLLVKDEEDRLPEALDSVTWADEVVVVDTGSTDGTRELALSRGARVAEVPWEGYVRSRNRAHATATHDWVLVLDADERVTPPLRDEIREALAQDGAGFDGFTMPRLAHLGKKPVRHGTWYPDVKLRLGKRSSNLRAEGGRVHEHLTLDGRVGRFRSPLLHFPYRDISDSIRKASQYARLSALDRFERGARGGVASLVGRPPFEFFRCFVLKAGFLDGRAGFATASLHAASYFLRAAYLLELERQGRRRSESSEHPAPEPDGPG